MHTLDLRSHFSDPSLDRLSAYFLRLFLHFGLDSFQYSLMETEKNMFISIHDYRLDSTAPPGSLTGQIDQLIKNEVILKKKYPSTVIGIESPYQTIVPSAFFDRDHVSKFLDFNFSLPVGYVIRYDHIPEIEAYNIYAIGQEIDEITRNHYQDAAVLHSSSSLIRVFLYHSQLNPDFNGLFLNVRERNIDLAYFKEKQLQFFNSFDYQSKEDLLYFTLYVIEQLKLRPDSAPLIISGLSDENSEAIKLLGQYIFNISFSNRIGMVKYSPVLNLLPSHTYQSLFGLALCGS